MVDTNLVESAFIVPNSHAKLEMFKKFEPLIVVFVNSRVVSPLEGDTEVTAGASARIHCVCQCFVPSKT